MIVAKTYMPENENYHERILKVILSKCNNWFNFTYIIPDEIKDSYHRKN